MKVPDVNTGENLTQQMQEFALYTVQQMDAMDTVETMKCMSMAENLWHTSEAKIRNSIDAIFVFTVSCHAEVKGLVSQFFNKDTTPHLYMAYLKQVNSSCI